MTKQQAILESGRALAAYDDALDRLLLHECIGLKRVSVMLSWGDGRDSTYDVLVPSDTDMCDGLAVADVLNAELADPHGQIAPLYDSGFERIIFEGGRVLYVEGNRILAEITAED